VGLVTISDFTNFIQIYRAIMNQCGDRCDSPDEQGFGVDLNMGMPAFNPIQPEGYYQFP